MSRHVVIVGGGAAGFFAAINCAEKNPDYRITILEKSSTVLSKVKISGGGRCNVTHACFDSRELAKNYPRGEKQLLGPFTRFNPSHTIDWFRQRGVTIMREDDGRMFPATNSSQTIIDCFLAECKRLRVVIRMQCSIEKLEKTAIGFTLTDNKGGNITADAVIITTGSSHSIWKMLQGVGHQIISPVPSLFTFHVNDSRIQGLEGLSVEHAQISVVGNPKLLSSGPLLITHWGMSGPAILKLSARGARELFEKNYQFEISVNWAYQSTDEITEYLKTYRGIHPKKGVVTHAAFKIPKRLWERLCDGLEGKNYADLSNKQIEGLAINIAACRFCVTGKSTFKDEFVTAGGVDLREVDFKTMQSKIIPQLYFAGEVLDIDAITGGFNFQAAWTTAWIAANSL